MHRKRHARRRGARPRDLDRAGIGIDAHPLGVEAVALRAPSEPGDDVAAAASEVEHAGGATERREVGADARAVDVAPARDEAVDRPEPAQRGAQALGIALRVVHELAQDDVAFGQAHPATARCRSLSDAGATAVVRLVSSADSTVSPGPNARPAMRGARGDRVVVEHRPQDEQHRRAGHVAVVPQHRAGCLERVGIELQARLHPVEHAAPARMDGPRGRHRAVEEAVDRAADLAADDARHLAGEDHLEAVVADRPGHVLLALAREGGAEPLEVEPGPVRRSRR